MDHRLLYVTTPNSEEAERIGGQLVEERLAACANILPAMTSVYRWQGALQKDHEAVLILKTRAELADRATARVLALHSYDCPCVMALDVAGGNPAFLDWITVETIQEQ